jgi:predicted porin
MKHSHYYALLMLACGVTFQAQAQSNVVLYGVADVGLQFVKSPNGTVARETSGIQNGSRWGLRGSEDLGNGLKADFVLESSVGVDTGSGGGSNGTVLFDRRSTVGVSGGFGSISLGRRDVPLYTLLGNAEPFGSGNSLGLNFILTGAGRGYTRRVSNQLRYETPNFSGFSGDFLYGLGESNTTNGTEESLNDVLALSLTYSGGPLYAGYAYNRSKDAANLGIGSFATVTTGVTPHKIQALAGSYDFKVVKLYGFYYTDKRNVTALTPNQIDQRISSLGVAVPFGLSTVALQVGKIKDKVARVTGPADASQYALAYLYALSKRTGLYASYGNVRNDNYVASTGGFTANGNGLVDAASSSNASNSVTAKSAALSFGIRHQF